MAAPWVDEATAARLAASTVRFATLVEFRFVSSTVRLWSGVGRLEDDGVEWTGAGTWGGIDQLPAAGAISAEKVTFSLSGATPEMLAMVRMEQSEVQDQPVYVWGQLLDDDEQPAGPRLALWFGRMQRLGVERGPATESSGGTRVIKLEAENPFVSTARSPALRYTDTEQQTLHPGDRFCRFVSDQKTRAITWPNY